MGVDPTQPRNRNPDPNPERSESGICLGLDSCTYELCRIFLRIDKYLLMPKSACGVQGPIYTAVSEEVLHRLSTYSKTEISWKLKTYDVHGMRRADLHPNSPQPALLRLLGCCQALCNRLSLTFQHTTEADCCLGTVPIEKTNAANLLLQEWHLHTDSTPPQQWLAAERVPGPGARDANERIDQVSRVLRSPRRKRCRFGFGRVVF